jgi:hypothetical protein
MPLGTTIIPDFSPRGTAVPAPPPNISGRTLPPDITPPAPVPFEYNKPTPLPPYITVPAINQPSPLNVPLNLPTVNYVPVVSGYSTEITEASINGPLYVPNPELDPNLRAGGGGGGGGVSSINNITGNIDLIPGGGIGLTTDVLNKFIQILKNNIMHALLFFNFILIS